MTPTKELFDLSGKVAVITGAGGAQGTIYANALADMGADIACADINPDAAERVAADIRSRGGAATAELVDITSPASVQQLAGRLQRARGRVNILINNAGVVSKGARTHDVTDEDWGRVLMINLTGAFHMIRALVPLLRAAGGGSIINNASMLGLVGLYPGFPMVNVNYAAAKAGLIGLTRQVAVEYAAENIRCNVIAAGWHSGSGLRSSTGMDDATLSRFESVVFAGTPMARRGRMDELRGLALWLASDASSYVTGQTITQDGGWTIT